MYCSFSCEHWSHPQTDTEPCCSCIEVLVYLDTCISLNPCGSMLKSLTLDDLGGTPIEETPGCFKDVIPAPVAPSRWRCPSDAPTKRPEKVASVLARVPGNPQYRWFMINVGKTIIHHPQNHHGWYTHVYTIKMGMVYDIVLPTLYVEKYLLGLDTVHDGIACLQRQELCMRHRLTCLPKGHSCSCCWFQTPFVLVKIVNSWCLTSLIGDFYVSWRDECFFAAFDGWKFRFPT